MFKRDHSEGGGNDGALIKKVRYEDEQGSSSTGGALMEYEVKSGQLIASKKQEVRRTSSLQAPTMCLTGHEKAIYSISLDPSGQHLASAGFDRNIFLWDVYGDCANYNVLVGHKNAVLEVQWASNSNHIMTCSADKTVSVWDSNKGVRLRKFMDHTGIVNSVSVAKKNPFLFASGSDDNTVKIWDSRCKWAVQSLEHEFQVTAVALSEDGESVFSGGIDNLIRRWDLKASEEGKTDLELEGHLDTITGLAISPDGSHILSNAMDSTLRKWDVRPYAATGSRCVMMYEGVHHGAEKGLLRASWAPDGESVACGSADRIVHIWDASSGKQTYYLPGHKGAVNEVLFHEKEPIVISCSSDKTIYIGELMAEE